MLIAVPAQGEKLESNLSKSFGRSAYFLIYNSSEKTFTVEDGSAFLNADGAGIKAAQLILDKGAEVVISLRCGENAATLLRAGGVILLRGQEASVGENLEAFFTGQLQAMSGFKPSRQRL